MGEIKYEKNMINGITYLILRSIGLPEEYRSDIWSLLCAADMEFVPPLSARSDTTQSKLKGTLDEDTVPKEYFDRMLKQQYILAIADDKVIGFMTFISDHVLSVTENEIECVYISTVIVDKTYRNRGITRCFYDQMMREFSEKRIATRTWSTNHSHIHLLGSIGFELIKRIKDDRGEGIDTVYFCTRS